MRTIFYGLMQGSVFFVHNIHIPHQPQATSQSQFSRALKCVCARSRVIFCVCLKMGVGLRIRESRKIGDGRWARPFSKMTRLHSFKKYIHVWYWCEWETCDVPYIRYENVFLFPMIFFPSFMHNLNAKCIPKYPILCRAISARYLSLKCNPHVQIHLHSLMILIKNSRDPI